MTVPHQKISKSGLQTTRDPRVSWCCLRDGILRRPDTTSYCDCASISSTRRAVKVAATYDVDRDSPCSQPHSDNAYHPRRYRRCDKSSDTELYKTQDQHNSVVSSRTYRMTLRDVCSSRGLRAYAGLGLYLYFIKNTVA